jgi:serine/threonine-protein kinase
MGSLFEAEDTGLKHRVALKLLHPHIGRRPGATERFLREGRAAARIRHPHVVQVFALGLEGETAYLAMELLDGGDLSQHIAKRGRLAVADALDLVLPVLAAVAAAHDAGVIHRDLKPSNVGLARVAGAQPWPKVVDFGVSKVIAGDDAQDVTLTDTVIGTAAYMAPEQARAVCNASFKSDQYSLAVMLYQVVTGALPFLGRSVYEIVESAMTAPLAPPSARASGIPREFDEAILRAMSRDPDERFPSVRAFGGALLVLASDRTRTTFSEELRHGSYVSDEPVTKDVDSSRSETQPPTRETQGQTPGKPRPRLQSLAWGALAASVLVAAGLAVRPGGASPSPTPAPAFASRVSGVDPGGTIVPTASITPASASAPTAPSTAWSASNAALNPAGPTKRAAARAPKAHVLIGDNGAPILP